MHKKFYNFMLPVLGAAVVVGSGFSAWVFSDTSVTDTLSGTFSIAPVVDNLKVEIKAAGTDTNLEAVELKLDQGGIANASEASKGITSTVTSYDIKVSYETVDGLQELLTNSKLTLSYTVAITSNDYFNLTDDLAKQSASDVVLDTYNAGTMSDGTIHTWSNVPLTWTYLEDKKPTNKGQYDDMTEAFKDSKSFTLTVTVNATWADK